MGLLPLVSLATTCQMSWGTPQARVPFRSPREGRDAPAPPPVARIPRGKRGRFYLQSLVREEPSYLARIQPVRSHVAEPARVPRLLRQDPCPVGHIRSPCHQQDAGLRGHGGRTAGPPPAATALRAQTRGRTMSVHKIRATLSHARRPRGPREPSRSPTLQRAQTGTPRLPQAASPALGSGGRLGRSRTRPTLG